MRYRLIKPDWAKLPEAEGGIPGLDSFDGDNYSPEYLQDKNQQGYGIYYFPNYNKKPIPKGVSTKGEHIDAFEWAFVDMDLKDNIYESVEEFIAKLVEFECTPSKVVRSGNGAHAYWRIRDLNRERYCRLQLKLIKYFRTDRSIWTTLRLMRLEGYYNTKKKGEFKLVDFEIWADGAYSYKELSEWLPELDKDEEQKIVNHLRKIDGLAPEIDLSEIDVEAIPEAFQELVANDSKARSLFSDDTIGKRSEKAWALACMLFDKDFAKRDAISIIANTPKASSKGAGALVFAADLVDKAYRGKAKFTVPNAADRALEHVGGRTKGRPVKGPEYFDCLHRGWRTQQCLGIVGGPGIGKSTVTLDIFASIIRNNPDSDDICIYFNLEMTDWEIIEKWQALTNGDPNLAKRLYVVSNEDDDSNPRNINLQQIVWFCRDIQKSSGKKIAAIAIDHIGVINSSIDIRKKPTFGLEGDAENAFGDFRTVSPRKMPQLLKELAKQLDVFVLIQSQTTKAKGMDGDVPLGIDAAYGAAQFEQYMDYVITLCQPLRRVEDQTEIRALGWQYVKIRSKHNFDKIKTYSPRFLCVDINTGKLMPPSEEQELEFDALNKQATILRKKTEKKEEIQYSGSKGGISKLKQLLAVK